VVVSSPPLPAPNMGDLSDNLYIQGFPVNIDEESLKHIFSAYGNVMQCKVLPTPPGGNAKGAALVRFASVDEATWIVDHVNGNIPHGLTESVVVRYANQPGGKGKPSASSGDDGKSRAAPYSGESKSSTAPEPNDNLYVTGLPLSLDNDLLRQFFAAYGSVGQCKVLPSRPNATGSVALVRFTSIAEATKVKTKLDGTVPEGHQEPLRLKYASSQMRDKESEAAPKAGAPGSVPPPPPGKTQGRGQFSIKILLTGFENAGSMPAGSGFAADERAVYVAGLPGDCEDIHLYQLFSPFGPIAPKGIRAMRNTDGSCKGFGFVNYLLPESAQAAISTFNGCELPDGSILKASIKRDKSAMMGAPKVVPAPSYNQLADEVAGSVQSSTAAVYEGNGYDTGGALVTAEEVAAGIDFI